MVRHLNPKCHPEAAESFARERLPTKDCHPEQASFARRGIWASRAEASRSLRRNIRAFGSLPYQTEPRPSADRLDLTLRIPGSNVSPSPRNIGPGVFPATTVHTSVTSRSGRGRVTISATKTSASHACSIISFGLQDDTRRL